MDKVPDNGTGITVQGKRINNVRFADDIDMIEESLDQLRKNAGELEKTGSKAELKINTGNTKIMVFGRKEIDNQIVVEYTVIENVEEFTYLGSVLT